VTWIVCRSRTLAQIEGEGVHTVGPVVAREPKAAPASRKNGGDASDSGASHRCGALGDRALYFGHSL
jgi:hypothetical protein